MRYINRHYLSIYLSIYQISSGSVGVCRSLISPMIDFRTPKFITASHIMLIMLVTWQFSVLCLVSLRVGHGSLFQSPTQLKISGPNPTHKSLHPTQPNPSSTLWHIRLYRKLYTTTVTRHRQVHSSQLELKSEEFRIKRPLQCSTGHAPVYPADDCQLAADASARRLRSADTAKCVVRRTVVARTTTSATGALQRPDHVCGTRYHST